MKYTYRCMIFVPVPLIRCLLIVVFVSLIYNVSGQTTCRIVLSDPSDSAQKVAILHRRTFIETLYKPFNPFVITVDPNDTLYVMSRGYKSVVIPGTSIQGHTGVYTIQLNKLYIALHEVRIRPMVHLDTLALRTQRLGILPEEYRPTYSNVDAVTSPFSALWEQFNSEERQKRKVAALLEEKDMHDIMVAYFDICNKEGIIDIPRADYDDFLQYCRFTPQFLKNNTQYDILNTIRYLYIQFTAQERRPH